jgi:hypothetical protein
LVSILEEAFAAFALISMVEGGFMSNVTLFKVFIGG